MRITWVSGKLGPEQKINSPSISFRNFLIQNQSFTPCPQWDWSSSHNQYRGSCVLEATCILDVGFLAPGHNQYRNKCHLIPPSCSWGLPWVGLPRGVSFNSQEKMCPSIAWHRARFARPFQTHHCGEGSPPDCSHHGPGRPRCSAGGSTSLPQCSKLALYLILSNQCFVLVSDLSNKWG